MTQITYRAEIFQEADIYVAYCRELDLASQADTPQAAADALQEAVQAFIEGCQLLGTLDDIMTEAGFHKTNGAWKLRERITQDSVASLP